MSHKIIGFLGTGHMNGAIIEGILAEESTNITPKQLIATCRHTEHAQNIGRHFGISAHCDNKQLIESSDIIIIGVKPQQMQEVLLELSNYPLNGKIFISLAAGIKLEDYHKILGEVPILRAMPNIAVQKQVGVTGIFSDTELSEKDEALIESIFNAVGSVVWVEDETQLDGILALSGSGLAFVLRFMQAMVDAGEQFGFEQDELFDIVALTTLGAATLALESNDKQPSYAAFLNKIAVAGGTTAQGLKVMDNHQIDKLVRNTFQATIDKNQTLNEDLTKDW